MPNSLPSSFFDLDPGLLECFPTEPASSVDAESLSIAGTSVEPDHFRQSLYRRLGCGEELFIHVCGVTGRWPRDVLSNYGAVISALIVYLAVSIGVAYSQTTTFAKWFGGPKYDAGFCAQSLAGGGFILVGTSLTLTNSWNDIFLVRTDCAGDTLWTRTIGGAGDDDGFSVCQTSDGGFAVAGTKSTRPPDSISAYIVRVDSAGTLVWTTRLRLSIQDYALSICETRDSGLAIAGIMGSGPYGRSDGWLIRTNRFGDTLWTKTYGGSGDDGLRSILLLSDDGFLLCGYTNTFGGGSFDFYLVRTNAQGDTLWTRTYGGSDYEAAWSVDAVDDSGFIVGGVVTRGAPPTQTSWFSLVRINENGDTLWTSTIENATNESSASVRHTRDGGFALVGTTSLPGRGADVLLVKTDQRGESQWQRSFGRPFDDNGSSVQQCLDGGFVIAGMVCENTFDAYLVKTDEFGLVTDVDERILGNGPALFRLYQNYPNPFNPSTTISYLLPIQSHVTLKVFDVLGREVATLVNEERHPGAHTVRWDANGIASGVYFFRLQAGSFADVRNVLLLH